MIQEERTELLLRALQEEKIKYYSEVKDDDLNLSIIFAHKKSLRSFSKFKNRLLVLDSNEEQEGSSLVKLNYNSMEEISQFLDRMFMIERRLILQNKIRESERIYDRIKLHNIENFHSRSIGNLEKIKDLESLLDLEIVQNLHSMCFRKLHVLSKNLIFFVQMPICAVWFYQFSLFFLVS